MLNKLIYLLNFEWLTHVSIGLAKSVFLVLFVLIGVLVLFIPSDYIYEGIEKRRWWHNFLSAPPRDLPTGIRRAEVSLSAPLDSYRLTARYDLLAADAGERLVIVDWKTHRPKDPQRLLEKLQSVVYPYVLVEAGAAFNGGRPVRPEQVAMAYWFADLPDNPLRLDYDATQHAADHDRLMALVREIETYYAEGVGTWPLTDFSHNCKFCTYRSLCDRGSAAGDLDDLDEELEIEELPDIDLEQVAEIVFQ